MYIYLAHPIDFANGNNTIGAIADTAIRELHAYGATAIYRPGRAWKTNNTMHPRLQMTNMHALREADGVFAILPEGVTSLGVPFELGYAWAMGLPVVLIRGENQQQRDRAVAQSALLSFPFAHIFPADRIDAAARTLTLAIAGRPIDDNE